MSKDNVFEVNNLEDIENLKSFLDNINWDKIININFEIWNNEVEKINKLMSLLSDIFYDKININFKEDFISHYWKIIFTKINNAKFEKNFIVARNNFLDWLSISNCIFKNLCIIEKNHFSNWKLQLSWNTISTLMLKNNEKLNIVNINWSFDKKSEIWNLDIFWDNNDIFQLSLANTNIKNFIIQDISNFKENSFFNRLEINNMHFITTNLDNFNFSSSTFKKLTIYQSIFHNTIFNWINFPENYILEDNFIIKNYPIFYTTNYNIKSRNEKISNSELKDNYRQLKFVMDKNWNYTEWNKFYSLEMEYYMKSLDIDKKKVGFFSLFYNNDWCFWTNYEKAWDIFSLKLSYLISNFWNNLYRVAFSIISYISIIYMLTFLSWLINELYINSEIISDFIMYIFIIVSIILLSRKNIYEFFDKFKVNIYFSYLIKFISFIVVIITLNIEDYKSFHWIKTLAFILNPLSWIDHENISKLVWTKQIGLIFHKIIYATLIYHLIVTIRRNTKR
jgi:hypothetical protein